MTRKAQLAGALALLLMVGSCSYAEPLERSAIESAVRLPTGGVAVVFRRLRYRPAAGLAAFPDGGVPQYLRDDIILGVLSDGPPRILRTFPNRGEHGSLHAALRVSPADPDHGLLLLSWQDRDGSRTSWARIAWKDGTLAPYPDFAAELRREGRQFGSPEFGDVRPLDATGALLVGVRATKTDELWIYEPGHGLRRLDGFTHFYGVTGDELYYWSGDSALVRNWRTNAARLIARYDPATRTTTRYLLSDPTVLAIERPPAARTEPEIASEARAVRAPNENGVMRTLSVPPGW
jgi:hypothetical protein